MRYTFIHRELNIKNILINRRILLYHRNDHGHYRMCNGDLKFAIRRDWSATSKDAEFDYLCIVSTTVNLCILVIRLFMDTTPAMMVLSPILLPIALSIGMNPIHFGVIMVVNLAIGFITPPLGINLFVAARVGREPLETVTSGIVRFMVVMLICLMLITFIPAISMLIPNAFM
ncbi:MAG: TRAP transporter large permease subunit [[Clostridium] scindens]